MLVKMATVVTKIASSHRTSRLLTRFRPNVLWALTTSREDWRKATHWSLLRQRRTTSKSPPATAAAGTLANRVRLFSGWKTTGSVTALVLRLTNRTSTSVSASSVTDSAAFSMPDRNSIGTVAPGPVSAGWTSAPRKLRMQVWAASV